MATVIQIKLGDLEQILADVKKAKARDWSLSDAIKIHLIEETDSDFDSDMVSVWVENSITKYTDKNLGLYPKQEVKANA